MLLIASVLPQLMSNSKANIIEENFYLADTVELHFAFFPWGLGLLLLVVRPIDALAIRLVGWCCVAFMLVLTGSSITDTVKVKTEWYGGNIFSPIAFAGYLTRAVGSIVCAALLLPLLAIDRFGCTRYACMRMPPRRQLHRLWFAVRLLWLVFATGTLLLYLDPLWPLQDSIKLDWQNTQEDGRVNLTKVIQVCSFVLATLVSSPRNRGRALRALGGRLSAHGSQTQEAASVAALIGGRSAAATLAKAVLRFRALPLDSLTRAELVNNRPDP